MKSFKLQFYNVFFFVKAYSQALSNSDKAVEFDSTCHRLAQVSTGRSTSASMWKTNLELS